ncbi:MAG: metallophosphoesterase family protein [Phycisphaeraceae bacterium]|nr:metallophosphoesterase family protein [Phycisphaeraceae bacterium]
MAIIGLLSDSHGQFKVTQTAVNLLLSRGAEILIHLGDVCSERVIDTLAPVGVGVTAPAGSGQDSNFAALGSGTDVGGRVREAASGAGGGGGGGPREAYLVFGNADDDSLTLARYAQHLGIRVHPLAGRLELGRRSLVFTHGHDSTAIRQALRQGVSYLCHGHSHRPLDEQRGPTRVINPGALYRASVLTVAILDTEQDRVVFHELPGG